MGASVYIAMLYVLIYRSVPRKDKPHGMKLVMLLVIVSLVITSTFALFYLGIIPLRGTGEAFLYILGALGIAITTEYIFKYLCRFIKQG